MKHRILCLASLLLAALIIWQASALRPTPEHLPGAETAQRRLLRIWLVNSVGGGESWLRACLKEWERTHPGVMTFLRIVDAEEVTHPDAVLPDLLLYTPGVYAAPEALFTPITGVEGLREELLRAGRWQGQQYGLPLCYAGYALAINSRIEPDLRTTPAPTTLLGRPAVTPAADATPTPGMPAAAALIAPSGCGLFTLGMLLPQRPALPDDFASADSAAVYQQFRAGQADAALLTTGQITALNGVLPFRTITPAEIITDQVWMASLLPEADSSAAELLAWLVSAEAQRKLSAQSLHTVREDLRLYAAGAEALIEQAARTLTAINAYVPAADTAQTAWQFFHGRAGISEALMPLL